MRQHASEQEDDEQDAVERRRLPAELPLRARDPDRKSRKVIWMRTTVPAMTATGNDQSMGVSARDWSAQMVGMGSV